MHMAKIGLNYGEKLQIADKTYRVITDGLDVPRSPWKTDLSAASKALISSLKWIARNAILMDHLYKSIQVRSVELL